MSENQTFHRLFESARKTLHYVVEGAVISFTEQVVARMGILNLKRTDLASKIGASPAYVTKLLRGSTNFTLESMVKVADSLDSELKIELVPKVSAFDWAQLVDQSEPSQSQETVAWCQNRCTAMQAKDQLFLGPFYYTPDPDEQFSTAT